MHSSHISTRLLLLALVAGCLVPLNAQAQGRLPFDRTNPIFYLNDDGRDIYTDEYLGALASAGEISWRSNVTQSSVPPTNPYVSVAEMEAIFAQRLAAYYDALASGFRNLPFPAKSSWANLTQPASGNIVDTVPIYSLGSYMIEQEAARATAVKPLVIVVGGPLTDVADAYLRDPSIASRVIVAFEGGTFDDMGDYNGFVDPWAAYIVLKQMRLVVFPTMMFAPAVSKLEIQLRLPDTPLKTNMLARNHTNGLLSVADYDAPPAIAIMRSDYVSAVRNVSFSGWVTKNGHRVPTFAPDPNGTTMLVTDASSAIAAAEWFRALTNPAAYAAPAQPAPPAPVPPVTPLPLPAGSTLISQTTMSLAYVSSQETVGENGAATNAFDGNPNTHWHTKWLNGAAAPPHEIQLNLGQTYTVSGFRYLARQESQNGRIASYEFYVSTDGVNWGAPVIAGTLANSAAEQQFTFTPIVGRFVRLRALSTHVGYAFASVAELNVLASGTVSTPPPTTPPPTTEPQTGWSLWLVDSQELVGEHGAAINAFDGNPNTYWHTEWLRADRAEMRVIAINLGQSRTVSGFRYLPRQDDTNGRIANYEFYVSTDGVNWGAPVVAGTLANNTAEQQVTFTTKVGQFIQLRALSAHVGGNVAAVAELNILP